MKYDDSNAEDSDALEGMTIKVIKPTDSAGTEGKIVIEFSSTTPKKYGDIFPGTVVASLVLSRRHTLQREAPPA